MFTQIFCLLSLQESLTVALVFILILCLIYYHYKRMELYICGWKLPGPISFPIIGCAYKFIWLRPQDIPPLLLDMNKEYGNILRFWLGPELNILVMNPQYLEKILSSNDTLQKGHTYKYIQQYLGQGLLASGGKLWKQQRKLVAPVFNKKVLENHLESFNIFSREIIENFKQYSNGKPFNIFQEIAESVNKIVCETLLGVEATEELKNKSLALHHVQDLYGIVILRMTKWWYQFDIVFNNSSHFKIHKKVTELINIFINFIHEKKFGRGHYEKNKNIALDSLVDPQTDFKLFGNIVATLQTTGEETISTVVSFVLLVLGIHKDIQKKQTAELEEVFGNSDRFMEHEDLSKLKYLDLVVKETLRMFPIASLITRRVEKPLKLTDDLTLPKDCIITIPIFCVHRSSEFWTEPNKFIPERFLPENSNGRHPLSYLPFSHGPMNCVGQTYASWCIKVLASSILRYYEVECEYKTLDEVKLMTDISIRPINGFKIKLFKKNDSI